jgi:hypothetical protein
MKRILLLLLLCISSQSYAKWVWFTNDDINTKYSYEDSKLDIREKDGAKNIYGWIMMDFNKPQVNHLKKRFYSVKQQFEITCKTPNYNYESFKITYEAYIEGHNGTGLNIGGYDFSRYPDEKIVPGSMTEFFVNYFCKLDKSKTNLQ